MDGKLFFTAVLKAPSMNLFPGRPWISISQPRIRRFHTASKVTFDAFIPFFAFRELGRVLGEGKIRTLFFRKRTGA
ncbi:MAG: hypothetical protein H6Q05_3423 [Acidobacteria bacterium]|nr:hypothetical protein [Acidobacteriota bacterium]